MSKPKHLFVLAAALVAATLSTARVRAQAECHFVCRWDQTNDSTTSSGYVIPGAASVGQEFRPTASSLDVVELMLEAQTSSSGSAFVRIRSGSITGTILGTSGSVSVSVPYPYPPSLRRFRFAQPVPLRPSATHVLEVVHSGGGSLGVYLTGRGSNTYSRGRAISQGAPVTGDDLWFREGASVGIEAPDQTNDSTASSGYYIPAAASVGQEFRPTASSLDVVELMMETKSSSSGSAFVRIRSGSITGTILGTSGSVSVSVPYPNPPSLRRFRFAQPVPLRPSATHVLEVVHSGGGSLAVYLTGSGSNTYSRGRAIRMGVPVTGDDLWFREGMSPHAIEVLDQANEFSTSGGFVIPGGAPAGQEFTPTASSLDVVELMMDAQSSRSGSAFVRIRSGSITGPILGTSASVSVSVPWPLPSLRRFRFAQPVPLSPPAIHVLEVVHSGGGSLGVHLTGTKSNTYPRGRAIFRGAPLTGADVWFREGTSVGIEAPDQTNDSIASSGYYIPGAASVGQEFRPTASSLDVVELMMEAQSSSSGRAFVRIRSGSITGTILGTSGSVSVSVPYPYPPSLRRFRFAQPVSLRPSATYVLEVVHSGGGGIGVYLTGRGRNTYSRGRAIYRGAPVTGDDLWFREGRTSVCGRCTLWTDRHVLSLKHTGTQRLMLDAGPEHAGRNYWILGSVTGTSPGVNLVGVHVPLNPDVYTDITIVSANTPIMANFRGTLSFDGTAQASFNVPYNVPPAQDITLHHAYIVYDNVTWYMASNPVSLKLRN